MCHAGNPRRVFDLFFVRHPQRVEVTTHRDQRSIGGGLSNRQVGNDSHTIANVAAGNPGINSRLLNSLRDKLRGLNFLAAWFGVGVEMSPNANQFRFQLREFFVKPPLPRLQPSPNIFGEVLGTRLMHHLHLAIF